MTFRAKKIFISLLFIITLICFQINLFAQGWQWQNPLPQGNTLSSVKYLNENIVWASVLGGGSILKSTDGGNSWRNIILPERIYVEDLFFANENIGWVCGAKEGGGFSSGIIMGTTNGGESWNIQLFDTIFALITISFANERVGWASGYGSKMYHTTNGGNNWILQAGFNGNVNSIHVLDSLQVWAANKSAASGAIFYTKDGGKNWLADSTINWAYDIQFLDSLNGWAAGRGYISNTIDGGKTWNTQLGFIDIVWRDICFADKNYGWAISYNKIAMTTNGGKNWSVKDTHGKYGLYAISFYDSLNGLSVGGTGTIYKSINGGKNWQLITESVTNSILTDIFFLNNSTGWIIGWDGTILKTEDAGNSWLNLGINTSDRLRSVFFVNDSEGFVAGGENALLKTTNGGLSWYPVSEIKGNWTDMDFRNYPIGWVIGGSSLYQCKLIKTANGGENWNEITSISFTSGTPEIHFTSKETGWIIIGDASSGGLQQLYKTTDGGDTWNLMRWNYSDTAYYSWHFISDEIGWISTFFYPPSILNTTDGGVNWKKHTTPESLKSIYFVDSLNGWGASLEEIYMTTDGGKSWSPQRAFSTQLQKIKFIDNKKGFAIGLFGNILYTTTGGVTGVYDKPGELNINDFLLYQNYPNPFNSQTIISFDLPENESVISVYIYDMLGRIIKEIKTSAIRGNNRITWDGKTNSGNSAASGAYIYSVFYKGKSLQKKLIYLK